jgi:hypothetical protein
MDGLYEIVPGSVPIAISGRVWQFGPLRLEDYAELERRLLGLANVEKRRGARASRDELQDWLRSAEGTLCEFWLRLRGKQPDLTLAVVEELLADRTREISRKMAVAAEATGEYPLGNSPCRGRMPMHPAAASRFHGAAFSAA